MSCTLGRFADSDRRNCVARTHRRQSVRGPHRSASRQSRLADRATHHSASHFDAQRLHELPWAARDVRVAHSAPGSAGVRPMPRLECRLGPTHLRHDLESSGFPMRSNLSRRDLFSLLGRPLLRGRRVKETDPSSNVRQANRSAHVVGCTSKADAQVRVAIIQGRHCLAYTSFCSVCSERCPVAGAIKVEQGIPQVIADACTGCGVCQDVCPAPVNAVLVLPRQRIPRLPQTPADVSKISGKER
jgi:Pyruvate/2-oxoacid:ferredoxin oxidoreductase delta subunit